MTRTTSIKTKLLLAIFLVSFASIGIEIAVFYHLQKRDLVRSVQTDLLATARGVPGVVPSLYHDHVNHGRHPSEAEYAHLVESLTSYAEGTSSHSVYTCIKKDDAILFASTSADPTELRTSTYKPLLELYDTAPGALRNSFETSEITFEQYTDRYGDFYSVFVPMTTPGGLTYVVGADLPLASLQAQLRKSVLFDILFGAVSLAAVCLALYLTLTKILGPLSRLTSRTEMLFDREFRWSDEIRREVSRIFRIQADEVGRLARVLSEMESRLQTYLADLTSTTSAKERMESELGIAHDIQMGLLPQALPAWSNHGEFDLHAVMQPAKEVGGDLYDYFPLDDNRLFFLIGDVSDKGVPAALFMAVTKTLFKSQAVCPGVTTAEVMRHVNRELARENPWQMFVTAFAAVLDWNTGQVTYSDGGHEVPFVLRADGEVQAVQKKGGLALCFVDDYEYEVGTIDLGPGDTLLIYTDGVTEAMDEHRRMFGRQGIAEALRGCRDMTTAEDVTAAVMQKVREHAGTAPQSDDIAIVTVRYEGTCATKSVTSRSRCTEDRCKHDPTPAQTVAGGSL